MNLNPLIRNVIRKKSQIINYQTVRWLRPRKPFWLGLAKSKMFRIREPLPKPPEEDEINEKLSQDYDLELKSILNFIRHESPRWKKVELDDEGHLKLDSALEEKIAQSLKINEEWNATSKKLGEEWTQKMLEEEAERAKERIAVNEQERRRTEELVDEAIRREKILSANYITRENLDEAIENSLKTIEEFDFAIDLNGNKYYGRETLQKIPNQSRRGSVESDEMSEFVSKAK